MVRWYRVELLNLSDSPPVILRATCQAAATKRVRTDSRHLTFTSK